MTLRKTEKIYIYDKYAGDYCGSFTARLVSRHGFDYVRHAGELRAVFFDRSSGRYLIYKKGARQCQN